MTLILTVQDQHLKFRIPLIESSAILCSSREARSNVSCLAAQWQHRFCAKKLQLLNLVLIAWFWVGTALGASYTIGSETTLPALSSQIYYCYNGDTPADGQVQTLNPPLFRWLYNENISSYENDLSLRTFRFQLSQNSNFSPLYWDIICSNNFHNFLAPLTNANGTTYTGSNYWRIIYMNSDATVNLSTGNVHHFTISSGATNWDRSMLGDSNYLYSVMGQHPHMLFWDTNRAAVYDWVRKNWSTYTANWLSVSNAAVTAVREQWLDLVVRTNPATGDTLSINSASIIWTNQTPAAYPFVSIGADANASAVNLVSSLQAKGQNVVVSAPGTIIGYSATGYTNLTNRGSWLWASNYTYWNNENVFTNYGDGVALSKMQSVFWVAYVSKLATNAFLASSDPVAMLDLFNRTYIARGWDRREAYAQGGEGVLKTWAIVNDLLWPDMNETQRSNAVYATEQTVRYYLWEDWWCQGSDADPARIYSYGTRKISVAGSPKTSNAHGRVDAGVGWILCMSMWAHSEYLREAWHYFMNYALTPKDAGGGVDGRGYLTSVGFNTSRNMGADLVAIPMFRAAKLELNPWYSEMATLFAYLEPVSYRALTDPWGDLPGATGIGMNPSQNSSMFFGDRIMMDSARFLNDGRLLRQLRRHTPSGNLAAFNELQITFGYYFPTPSESDWSSTAHIDTERGWAMAGSLQPNDYGSFTNGVWFTTQAKPSSPQEHDNPGDGGIQLTAFGAAVSANGAGDYRKHPMYQSAMVFVDGIGPVQKRFVPIPGVSRRARFTAFTNTSDFTYIASDTTEAYNKYNPRVTSPLPNEETYPYYGYSTNLRPYLVSMKRHILFPHKKYLVLYDTMSTTRAATFQWNWHTFEPTLSINTNACSFTYTCTNLSPSVTGLVTVYVVPFMNPALMTLTNISGRTDETNSVSVRASIDVTTAGRYKWNGSGSFTNGAFGIYGVGRQWYLTNATALYNMYQTGNSPNGQWVTNGGAAEAFTSNWSDDAYGNPFTGEDYSGAHEVYPNQRPKGNLWAYNKTPTNNWHFGWVVYPVKWGHPAPNITRINDYAVRIRSGPDDDTITIDSGTDPAMFTLDLNGVNIQPTSQQEPGNARIKQ